MAQIQVIYLAFVVLAPTFCLVQKNPEAKAPSECLVKWYLVFQNNKDASINAFVPEENGQQILCWHNAY